jgi:hypothetical protein
MTGTSAWANAKNSHRGFSPVLADDKIFFYADNNVAMVKTAPEKLEELGRFEPVSGLMGLASPAIAGGRLYLRLNDCLACTTCGRRGNDRRTRAATQNRPRRTRSA